MNILSLFSGVGGFDMGLEAAGWKTIFQCEIDKHCQTVLAKHWPDVPKWGDVSTLTGKHIIEMAGPPDVVAWGSPCQDLSVAGKRAGLEGMKSGLFHEGIRIIKEIRELTNNEYPRISIWENVPGALSSNNGADFGVVLDEMAKAGGLALEWAVLDAQYFGVPQRRRRIFLSTLFHSGDAERSGIKIFPVAESLPGHITPRPKKGKRAAANSSESTQQSGESNAFRMTAFGEYADDETASAMKARDYKDATDLVVERTEYAQSVFAKSRHAKDKDDFETWVDGTVSPTLNTFENHVDTRSTVAIVNTNPLIIDGTRVDDVRVYDDGTTPTLTHRMGTGGNNTPMVFDDRTASTPPTPIVLDRASFNQGPNALWEPLMEEAQSVPALVARGPHAVLDTSTQPIVFEPGAMSRMKSDYYSDHVAPTLRAQMGDNQPAVVQPDNGTIVFNDDRRIGPTIHGDTVSTLQAFMGTGGNNTPMVAQIPTIPIQDGRDIEKNQNGFGVGENGDPSYTIDTTGAQAVVQTVVDGPMLSFDTQFGSNANVTENVAPTLKASQQSPSVAYSIREDAKANNFSATEINVANSLSALQPAITSHHAQTIITDEILQYDGYNQKLEGDGSYRSLRVGRDASDFVSQGEMVVRRLTPLECERLMGWSDFHTKFRADGSIVPDTQRYKMCGNGVASPCAEWVAKQLIAYLQGSMDAEQSV